MQHLGKRSMGNRVGGYDSRFGCERSRVQIPVEPHFLGYRPSKGSKGSKDHSEGSNGSKKYSWHIQLFQSIKKSLIILHYNRSFTSESMFYSLLLLFSTNHGSYLQAVEEIKAGRINAYQASKKYSIPYPKIKSHLKGRRGIKSKSFGRSTAIPIEYEKRLVEGLLKMEKYGFGLSRKEVQQLVGQFTSENSGYPGTTYAATSNGWMEAEIFQNYFQKSFLKTIGTDRSVLLILDGHSTHLTIRLIEIASQENVTILKLPPHTSYVLQPLDLSVFKPLKTCWDAKLVKWHRKNIGVRLPKREFSRMIGDVWSDLYPNIIINGFKKAGIHPLSRNVVPDSIYRATDLKRWNDAKMTEKDHYTQMAQDTNAVIGEDTLHPPIILERIAENSVDVDNFEEIHIKNSEIEETQYCTNREPDPSLVPKKLKTFEELLLDTIIANTSCA
ncbi:hypothetical protein HUJ04_007306 [Dendroctonus ponderosae]|nr:hypothetical protein HUJ04_007306 [Dendroctonus ponderosae]